MRRTLLLLLIVAFTLGCLSDQAKLQTTAPPQTTIAPLSGINSFEECADAGYPVMESYPRQCRTPDGRTFVEVLEEPVTTPPPTTLPPTTPPTTMPPTIPPTTVPPTTLPPTTVPSTTEPPVTIPSIKLNITIDGDSEDWEELGIEPLAQDIRNVRRYEFLDKGYFDKTTGKTIDVKANDLADIYGITNGEGLYFLIQTVENNSDDEIQILFKSHDNMNYYFLIGKRNGELGLEYGSSRTSFISNYALTQSEISYSDDIEIRISKEDLKKVGVDVPLDLMLGAVKLVKTFQSGKQLEEFGDELEGIYIDIPNMAIESENYGTRKIVVDGKPDEWRTTPSLVTDPPGDFRKINGSDLKAIYGAVYKDKIYFMIERYLDEVQVKDDLKMSYIWGGTNKQKFFQIQTTPSDFGQRVPEGRFRWPNGKPAVEVTTYPGTDPIPKVYFVSPEIVYGEVVEFAIPFEAFEDMGFDDPSKITFWAYIAWNFDALGDVSHPDRYISIPRYPN